MNMSSSGTPVGLGYGDYRDRDGRVSKFTKLLNVDIIIYVQ